MFNNFFHKMASPKYFYRIAGNLIPWLATGCVLLFLAGLYYGLFKAPPDYQQGDSYRIMFIHVPAAWVGMGCYAVIAIAALGTLIWRHPLADVAAKAAELLNAHARGELVTGSFERGECNSCHFMGENFESGQFIIGKGNNCTDCHGADPHAAVEDV